MDVELLKTEAAFVARYIWLLDNQCGGNDIFYKYGENDFVDTFLNKIDPFVQAVSGQRITEPDYYWIWGVTQYSEGIILDVEHRFGSREKIDVPFTLLLSGLEGIPRYLKEKEFNSVVDQIQTVQEHITKCQSRLATLEQRLNRMVSELWPEGNNNEH